MHFFNDEWESFIEHCGFTDVELEIVQYLRRGWACVDVAAELFISESTVKRKRKVIGQKIIRYIEKEG